MWLSARLAWVCWSLGRPFLFKACTQHPWAGCVTASVLQAPAAVLTRGGVLAFTRSFVSVLGFLQCGVRAGMQGTAPRLSVQMGMIALRHSIVVQHTRSATASRGLRTAGSGCHCTVSCTGLVRICRAVQRQGCCRSCCCALMLAEVCRKQQLAAHCIRWTRQHTTGVLLGWLAGALQGSRGKAGRCVGCWCTGL